MVRAIIITIGTGLCFAGAEALMGREVAIAVLVLGLLFLSGVGLHDLRRAGFRWRSPIRLPITNLPHESELQNELPRSDASQLVREWAWKKGVWLKNESQPGTAFQYVVADEQFRSFTVGQDGGSDSIIIGTSFEPQTDLDREAFRSIPPMIRYRLVNNLRMMLTQMGIEADGLGEIEKPLNRIEIVSHVPASSLTLETFDGDMAHIRRAAMLVSEFILKAHLDGVATLKRQLAEVAGNDANNLPPIEMVTANEGQHARLRLFNLGTNDRLRVDVISVGDPVNFKDRYPVPWREMDHAANLASAGLRLISGGGDGIVNIAERVTASGTNDVDELLQRGVDGTEVVRFFSASHQSGHIDVSMKSGTSIPVEIEAVGERTGALRRRYVLSVEDEQIDLRLSPQSTPDRSRGQP